MSRPVRRLILVQGALQLLNALAVIREYDAAASPETRFEDVLLFGGMLAGEATQALVDASLLLARAYPWASTVDIAPHEDSLYRLHTHRPSRAHGLLHRLVGAETFDVVVSARSWQQFNELCLGAYADARHICIGDGFGLVDFLEPPRGHAYQEVRQLLPIFDNVPPGGSIPAGPERYVVVPKEHARQAIRKICAGLDPDSLLAGLPDPADTTLLLGSSWNESGMMQLEAELRLYELLTASVGGTILYKPHPRSSARKMRSLQELLGGNAGRRFLILDERFRRLPIEVLLHAYRPRRVVTSHSSSIRNLRLLYPQLPLEYFSDDGWLQLFNPAVQGHMARVVRDERQILANIADWDGHSPLMLRWVDKLGREA